MPLRNSVALALTLLGAVVSARDVPGNIQSFLDNIRAQKQCKNVLAGGFHSSNGDSGDFEYCGDHLKDFNVIYLQGRNGQLVNLDIDCDGVQRGPADDGRCGSSSDTQSQSSFRDELQGYGAGQKDLNAHVHPYVVFGNNGERPGWRKFDPTKYGVEPLSVMAVVCDNKLVYGIWGDTNGDDAEEAMVGEASISLATACFGKGVNGNAGHDENDVLYIAFPGKDAVPGAKGAKWNAKSYQEFDGSISRLGDQLIQRIDSKAGSRGGGREGRGGRDSDGGGDGDSDSTTNPAFPPNGNGNPSSPTPDKNSSASPPSRNDNPSFLPIGKEDSASPSASNGCSRKGRCKGASCKSYKDCSDELVCESGKRTG
ncbi:fungal chitosanase of glycosyl hydrolase group 75 domain-containing protein [Hirsutella rhossiliensis]|uniref:Endo-chitosanase n=1 Tax=Hirsutella rhossiliensis TaxID=111463 RepID=A0A9P8MVE6_9HYPO|nr:fungal chitosanase of glycosyl hydrolase group 75 domain-containing protein [Hirsutella rhossiliensis]KAH0961975.1 fungal chitosanase of glycosyl hydrolase group 75 domain-containing protein [Hirsutella rhossiliensis]